MQPLLNSLRMSIEAASTGRMANNESIRTLGIGLGAVSVAVILVIIALVVCIRAGQATKNRMSNMLMSLATETNLRPSIQQPPFRV